MESTTYAGLPVPEPDEADAVPYWLGLVAEKLDTTTILSASSAADRDARYAGAPRGVIVVCDPATTITAVWIKTGAAGTATWATIWELAPTGQQWFPPASIGAGWVDLHTLNAGVAPFCFNWDERTDTILIRGALYKADPWTQGEVVAYTPADMIPTYAAGWSGATYTSSAAVASGEIRDVSGQILLWVWSLHQGVVTSPNGAIWFDGTSFRKGDLT